MAMLMLNSVFERTWGARAGVPPDADCWAAIIKTVQAQHPDFKFIAEAYWDLEWELQQQGFDFCYDKRLYDRLEKEGAESVRLHLLADMGYQEKLLRFIENHDEPRAASVFPPERLRAVAVAALTLPGARLIHEGQREGCRVRLPVFLGRRPIEAPDERLSEFHLRRSGLSATMFSKPARGAFANAAAGRTTRATGTCWPGAGVWERIAAWWW